MAEIRADISCIPPNTRNLRACLLCSMIKSADQFEIDGCDNCDNFLQMKGNRENMYTCTSSNFDGMVALTDPPDSWVGKWLRISRFTPGIYAISVSGRLPPDIIREVKARDGFYKSRDRSNQP